MAKKKTAELEEVQMADVESAITIGDSNIAETDLEIAEAVEKASPVLSLCKPETDTDATEEECIPDLSVIPECEESSKTETDEEGIGVESPENSEQSTAIPKTETGNASQVAEGAPDYIVKPESEEIVQTETETEHKPKKKRKTPSEGAPILQTEIAEGGSDSSATPSRKKKAASVKPKSGVVAIDAVRQVETDADKTQNDLLD